MNRKCQIQTHRKNSHSKFSQTVTSKQWRSRKLSVTVAGTGANNVGSNAPYRPSADNALMRWIVRHAAWLIPRFRGGEVQSPIQSCHGRDHILKIGGVWRNSSSTPSRGRKRIWKSSTKVGRQMEVLRVAGKERPHGRTPCPNR